MGLGKTYSTQYLADSNNNTGVAGQVLSTTSTGIDWADANTLPGAGLWLEIGNDIYNSNLGNVGIGTTNTSKKLSINASSDSGISGVSVDSSNASTSTQVGYTANNVDGSTLFMGVNGYGYTGGLGPDNSGAVISTIEGEQPLVLGTNSIERVRIDGFNGNVGIGTTSPSAKLEVAGTVKINTGADASNPRLYFQQDDIDVNNFIEVDRGSKAMEFWNNGSERMRITSDGNVGIGTTSPGAKLEVNGDIGIDRVAGGYTFREAVGGSERASIKSNATNELIFSYGASTEAMRITSAGILMVGGTTGGYAGTKIHVGNFTDTQNGINILTSTTGYGYVLFGDGTGADTYRGQITYNHANDSMSFNTNGSEKLRIVSGGGISFAGATNFGSAGQVLKSNGSASPAWVDASTVIGGPYLPLAAGSGSSLTDNLYINDVDQNNVNRYGNLQSEVGFTRSPVTGNPNQWFKVVTLGGSPKRIKFSIIATGDNTNSYDNFLISTSGYGMNMHIEKLPGGRYNTSKLLSVAVINPSDSGSVEIWIKLGPVSSGTGVTYVACTSDVLASTTILASATTTAPTLTSNDTQLDISGDNRNHATIQTSRGATFGAKVGIGTNAPAAMLTVAGGDATITGNVGIGTTSPSTELSVNGAISAITSDYVQGTTGSRLLMHSAGTGNSHSYIQAQNSGGTSSAEDLALQLYGGNVGIGTDIPGEKLSVNGNIFLQGSDNYIAFNTSASSGHPKIKMNSDADFSFLNTAGSNIFHIENGGNVGIGTVSPNYKLEVDGTLGVNRTDGIIFAGSTANGNKITADTSNDFIFSTSLVSAPYTVSERMRIANSGAATFTSTVTATNFILSSDERLKENIEKACDNRIKADWKTFELKTDKGQKRYGVIAQELEKTNPEFVREDTQGFKSVAYIDLLIAKIAELEARLEKAGI